jgi:hypothetical protein
MPPIQGYINATLLDMTEVFGEPENLKGGGVQWKLDGGTVLCDRGDLPGYEIAGWSAAAVDQVIGLAARAGRFLRVAKAKGRETVHLAQAPAVQLADPEPVRGEDVAEGAGPDDVCGCGEPITMYDGAWLHIFNPELRGTDDHDAHPASEFAV